MTTTSKTDPKRVILLMRASTYRGQSFYQAAQRLGIEIVPGINMHPDLAEYWQVSLPLQFDKPDQAVQTIVEFARQKPVHAILAVDDSASIIAAQASEMLGFEHNSAESALAARNKYHMRRLFAEAGVPSAKFKLYDLSDDPAQMADEVPYPCVLKPLLLSGSRGVIRANNPAEFVDAFRWLGRMLSSMERTPGSNQILVEDFIPGFEVALEGIIDQGQLNVLALFDKPDPLDGPFFEETIYVTPSRLPTDVQVNIATCANQAAKALGLRYGPVHAELRINEAGPWLIEIAGRSIGGLCSQTLNFGLEGISLEELILRQAVGLDIEELTREDQARGVMMIPIPSGGIYKGVTGIEAAERVPGVESVQITAKVNYPLTPLPEGESYLGFIFAKREKLEEVEAALREAHRQLRFKIEEVLPILPVTG
jgi:biotin carboxylase